MQVTTDALDALSGMAEAVMGAVKRKEVQADLAQARSGLVVGAHSRVRVRKSTVLYS